MAQITAKPFRLALLQLSGLTGSKQANIDVARRAVLSAAKSNPKPELIVLPEIWNSPYAVGKFREYSEVIPEPEAESGSESSSSVDGNVTGETEGETVKALREMARSAGCWLIGGELVVGGSMACGFIIPTVTKQR